MKVKNLIDCNAIEAENFLPVFTEFNVKEAALDILEITEIYATDKNIQTLLRVEDSLSADHHLVRTDEGRLKQVLLNLVQSAINDSKNDSTITIDFYLQTGPFCDLGPNKASSVCSSDFRA